MPNRAKSAERIAAFLAKQPGQRAGNKFVRDQLELSEVNYWEARKLLIAAGRVATGRGRGGSVRLLQPVQAAPPPSARVDVAVQDFAALLAGDLPLALDDYQRPYVWTPAQALRLVDDLLAHRKKGVDHPAYYMGTLLLHADHHRGHRYVIDGQQRISTLCLLYHAIHGALPVGQALRFRAPESATNLRRARTAMHARTIPAELLQQLRFTVITVHSEDLAFTFFDTQNSRGVTLEATDLLKAFHLRAIRGPRPVLDQERCARFWEDAQQVALPGAAPQQSVQLLFEHILWRARRWTGQGRLGWEHHDALMAEFETATLPAAADGRVPLYTTGAPPPGAHIVLGKTGDTRVKGLQANGTRDRIDLPMAIRQPLSRGLGFFLFTERYLRLTERLFSKNTDEVELRGLRAVDRMHATAGLSAYLRQIFRLATVLYVDRLGTRQLDAFCLWMDHRLGAVRLSRHSVFRATAMNIVRTGSRNLLDLLAAAYRPEEVLAFLQEEHEEEAAYSADAIPEGGVRRRYADAVVRFYKQQGPLSDKRRWIETRLAEWSA